MDCLFVVVDGWRKVALEIFNKTEGNYGHKCDATYDMLNREHPDSQWSVFVFEQYRRLGRNADLYSAMSNGGREAEERGWEEEGTWINIQAKDQSGRECLCTLYIWRALKSHYHNKLRKATDEEKKKMNEVIDSLEAIKKRELQLYSNVRKMNWSIQRWRDELIQQMNNTQLLNWKHIVLTKYLFPFVFFCEFKSPHSCFGIGSEPQLHVFICFTDK